MVIFVLASHDWFVSAQSWPLVVNSGFLHMLLTDKNVVTLKSDVGIVVLVVCLFWGLPVMYV
jgi:hypothetical protein